MIILTAIFVLVNMYIFIWYVYMSAPLDRIHTFFLGEKLLVFIVESSLPVLHTSGRSSISS